MLIAEDSIDKTYDRMYHRLVDVVPDIELRYKAELVFQIKQLKKQRNAVILGHNYMEPALYHTVADYVGDSLELSRQASRTDADIIIFCGVQFMAETAKILSPDKTVLLPSTKAGCSLAESITAEDVRALKERFPGVPVVTYVNTYVDVKAESDACCTSSNAAAVIESFDSDVVIFLPDEYLARNVARETGKRIIFPSAVADGESKSRRLQPARSSSKDGPTLVGWPGRCEVHERFTVEDVRTIRKQFPDVVVLTHPECSPEVVDESDFSGSTTAMIRYVHESNAPRYLLLTECSMGDNIVAENPEKEMLRLCSVRCPHMNEITLEQTLAALENTQHVIEIDPALAARARVALDRMLEIRPSVPVCK
ncbi:MAG: quinolinate synthase NadA [Planctomycetes bacterium]|nr:quinolinate synthase NadA [Planctomycetota bacterium]